LLDKIAKIRYSDSVMYSASQDFCWQNLEDWTSYSSADSNIDILVCKYKKYLYSKRYTRNESDESDESQSSYWDPDMDIVFAYLRSLPKRIRFIINMKIVNPYITPPEIIERLKISKDTLYATYKIIRRDYPELIYFTRCLVKINKERDE